MRLKSTLTALALSLATLSAPALAREQDKPEPARVYKDWVVGCDRFSNCEAVAVLPSEDDWSGGYVALVLEVKRNGDVRIALAPSFGEEAVSKDVILRVDGQPLARLNYSDQADLSYTVISRKDARVLANGRKADLVDDKGVLVSRISLSGSSAAMRDMDARQGNAGFTNALVARGPKAKPLPAIAILSSGEMRLTPSQDGPPSTIYAEAAAFAGCLEDRREGPDPADVIVPLPTQSGHAKKALILVGCGHGAYNMITRPVMATKNGKEWKLSKAQWRQSLYAPEQQDFDFLVNAYWDEANELHFYGKGRGLGDCGDSGVYRWMGHREDGPVFVLTEMREMPICMGATYWPRIW